MRRCEDRWRYLSPVTSWPVLDAYRFITDDFELWNSMYHKHDIFVIEVLRPADYACFAADGALLVEHMRSLGFDAMYERCYTFESFKDAIRTYGRLGYSFLHLSCHGSTEGVAFYDDDAWNGLDDNGRPKLEYREHMVDYDTFAQAFRGRGALRRFTFSGCELGNVDLMRKMFEFNRGLESIVAPVQELSFNIAAPLWLAMYSFLLDEARKNSSESLRVRHKNIENVLKPIGQLFSVRFGLGLYNPNISKKKKESVAYKEILNGQVVVDKVIHEYENIADDQTLEG